MSKTDALSGSDQPLAPWLQGQLERLLLQQGHAWLLSGPSGLGQFDLALALATAWLCEQPGPHGACERCSSCHAVAVHTHADLCLLLPETLSLSLGWPLDEKTQDDLDSKKRKPSKEIKVDAARGAVAFTQFTRSRGSTKVVLVFPAERMNHITANTILKTLEEPPGAVKFILATEAAHQLLPTIRSRCLGHTMAWPDVGEALAWLREKTAGALHAQNHLKKSAALLAEDDLRTLLASAGGRPEDAFAQTKSGPIADSAHRWRTFPKAMARGDVSALADFAPALAVDSLQKLCHDMYAVHVGAAPRFFNAGDLPMSNLEKFESLSCPLPGSGLLQLADWYTDLCAISRSIEHPYNASLLIESLVSRAKTALTIENLPAKTSQ